MVRTLPLFLGGFALLSALAAPPADESRYFPKPNQVKTELVAAKLLGKTFLPGGNIGHYKKAGKPYRMFLARTSSSTAAAIALLDWKKSLKTHKLIAHFGGYYGLDGAEPVFVFAKGDWIAGIIGLTEKEADAEARIFAARLP